MASALLFACTEPAPPPRVAAPRPPASAPSPQAPPRHCAFQGVVRAESGTGAAPVPVAGALVAAISPGAEQPAGVTRTDDQGRYCFETLAEGAYGFTITAAKHTAAYVDVRDVVPAAPGAPPPEGAKLDVQLGGPGFVLRGRVVDDKGVAVAGARMLLPRMSQLEADLFVTETGADGRYEVKLPGAKYQPLVRTERVTAGAGVELDQSQTLDFVGRRLNPKSQPAPDEVVAWLRGKAVPLKTVEAEKGLADMQPLKALVGGARLVALGEATHGTREFFQLKHRMLEFLVEEMGFRSFGIEATFGGCLPLTEYVRTGKGDPEAALANQGFWTWDTEEVLALVEWMRRYNEDKAHKEKLSFWGFDMQSPASSTLAVLSYLQKVDRPLAKAVGPALEPIDDDWASQDIESAPQAVKAAARDAVNRIAAALDANQAEYIKKTSERTHRLARIHARVMADFLLRLGGDFALRDRSMADVAADLLELEGPNSKMVLWAHNAHVSESSDAGTPPMGAHLAKRFGDGYVSFGFAFDEGSFQAYDVGPDRRGVVPFTVPSAPPGSLDHTLARAGIPVFALSLQGAPKGAVSDWLSAASYTRTIGSVYNDRAPDFATAMQVLPEHYDALLFVQKTTAARPTETGKRPPSDKKQPPPEKLQDPGFEGAKKGELPAGWKVQSMPKQLGYEAEVDNVRCASGKRCLVMTRDKATVPTGAGTAATGVDAAPYRGKKVRVSASLRVAGKAPGDEAFLSVIASRAASGTPPRSASAQAPAASWKKVHVELDVPADADRLAISLVVTGAAKAGIDDIQVAVAGDTPAPAGK